MGKIHYTGITPHASRADYALPPGTPALDGHSAECMATAPSERGSLSRRALLGLGGALLGACSAYALGAFSQSNAQEKGDASPTKNPSGHSHNAPDGVNGGDPVIPYMITARKWAEGPLLVLVKAHVTFITLVTSHANNERILWQGMNRLAKFAENDRTHTGYSIAKQIRKSCVLSPPPVEFNHLPIAMEEFIRQYERTHSEPK